ncbi:MAG: L,D-transpeptidase [Hyphomicrobiaceae bacterium]
MPGFRPLAAFAAIFLSATVNLAPAAAAPAKKTAGHPSTLIARINLSNQQMTVSYDGVVQHSWAISSGREGYPTPRGTYRPQWTAKMWYSRKYDDAPMPHSVFFVGGVAVHATQAISMLGRPASHGCVRLAPANAAKFYSLVHKHGLTRTRIEVFGTPPPTPVASRKSPRSQRPRMAAQRPPAAAPSWPNWPWNASPPRVQPPRYANRQPQIQMRRGPGGLYYLPPGSPLRGRATFVYNGVVYQRVR